MGKRFMVQIWLSVNCPLLCWWATDEGVKNLFKSQKLKQKVDSFVSKWAHLGSFHTHIVFKVQSPSLNPSGHLFGQLFLEVLSDDWSSLWFQCLLRHKVHTMLAALFMLSNLPTSEWTWCLLLPKPNGLPLPAVCQSAYRLSPGFFCD